MEQHRVLKPEEKVTHELQNTLRIRRSAGNWRIFCWINIPAGIYRSCIVTHKALVLDGSLQYVQCVPFAEILQIFVLFNRILYCWIRSPAVSKRQEVQWCSFRWSIPSSIDYVCYSDIDRAISTSWCSYCIWNRYCQNHRSILPNCLLFAWHYTVKFNRRPCSNKKMYDDVVFSDRFRYQLTMFEACILIGLSRLLDTHIAYEIVI